MKRITFLAVILMSSPSFSQIATTSFEEPAVFSGNYTDTGDPNTAHALINNTNEPLVNFTSTGGELGFSASYAPYDTPDVGLTDGDQVGVTDNKPSTAVLFTDGVNGYQMNDLDGNFILEFDQVDLTSVNSPAISLDFLLSINSNPLNGNYEGDGTVNESGSDRLRIYINDITNSAEIDLFNSTGNDLDDFVPFDSGSGEYQLAWQSILEDLPNSVVQLVIEGRTNASTEEFWFDNIEFLGTAAVTDQKETQFTMFPNPSNNGYVIITSKLSGAINITIFDVLGKQIVTTSLTTSRLNIEKLYSGIYIVKIEQGNASIIKKLIVK